METNTIIQLKDSSWVIPGPTNIGLIEKNSEVYVIDSGNDKESGRKINKILKDKNWKLKGIINTHSNADHIGGNDYLQRLTNCDIWVTRGEAPFIEMPEMESSFLWGGFPFKELTSKFFEAKSSSVTKFIENKNPFIDHELQFIPLPGHFFDMVGVLTVDKVFYIGDCMFGENILQKYAIPFIYNVEEYKKTILKIKTIEAYYYVLSHGEIQTDIQRLADINLQVVENLEVFLLDTLSEKRIFEEVLKETCDFYKISLDHGQYVLVGSTVRSFLSYLYNTGKIKYDFHDNKMYWMTVSITNFFLDT